MENFEQMYRVLAKTPDMKRSLMVDASDGVLVNRKFHASMFTKEQAENYVSEAVANGFDNFTYKIIKF